MPHHKKKPIEKEYLYLIALGSNQWHHEYGNPHNIINSVYERLEQDNISVFDQSQTITSKAIGPSSRNFANSAAIILSPLLPPTLLDILKNIEATYGKRQGQKWGKRHLDIDIILWSGGIWVNQKPDISIPHNQYQYRDFVLRPAIQIAGDWRDPLLNLTLNQILFRYSTSKRVDRSLRYL